MTPTNFRYSRTLPPENYIENYPDILIDDEVALMTREDFDRLTDYSGSRPTGITIGKCWKDGGRRGPGRLSKGDLTGYALGYFTDCDPPEKKTVLTHYRPIVVVE